MLPVVGPLAAVVGLGIGAYTGSLAGAVNSMGPDAEISGPENVPRPAGVRVAVNVAEPKLRAEIIATFNRHHAKSIEEAEGTWREGAWADFDPIGAPRWVQKPAE